MTQRGGDRLVALLKKAKNGRDHAVRQAVDWVSSRASVWASV